ncbi:Plasmodium exported protein, unknown function [Plasmodium gallinaceum]|uniref:Plasmodium RESA N-terminal domain-containing protein n=1 Tax=Plasmodium gallinaceum TaxID=5849 RepID=A0A1J1GPR3_PLAGA|nr:Plasmodium exported protein, unknown function [Plasmodium gallinaceum]CRG94413.1 Plasmodium exported protein, unknown function [Plasmodium gallinaceum]
MNFYIESNISPKIPLAKSVVNNDHYSRYSYEEKEKSIKKRNFISIMSSKLFILSFFTLLYILLISIHKSYVKVGSDLKSCNIYSRKLAEFIPGLSKEEEELDVAEKLESMNLNDSSNNDPVVKPKKKSRNRGSRRQRRYLVSDKPLTEDEINDEIENLLECTFKKYAKLSTVIVDEHLEILDETSTKLNALYKRMKNSNSNEMKSKKDIWDCLDVDYFTEKAIKQQKENFKLLKELSENNSSNIQEISKHTRNIIETSYKMTKEMIELWKSIFTSN